MHDKPASCACSGVLCQGAPGLLKPLQLLASSLRAEMPGGRGQARNGISTRNRVLLLLLRRLPTPPSIDLGAFGRNPGHARILKRLGLRRATQDLDESKQFLRSLELSGHGTGAPLAARSSKELEVTHQAIDGSGFCTPMVHLKSCFKPQAMKERLMRPHKEGA